MAGPSISIGTYKKAMSNANTNTIIALLKNRPMSVREIQEATGLSRPTVQSRVYEHPDIQLVEGSFPKRYYVGDYTDTTIVGEQTREANPKSQDPMVKALREIDPPICFFPEIPVQKKQALHKHIMEDTSHNPLYVMYRSIKDSTMLAQFEHNLKTMFDLVQVRKESNEFKK
jgi:DNA-binding transcriptional regulator GbsR (MarR family)